MGKLTLDSTFDNIRELIEGDDKVFVLTAKKMAEYENESTKNAFFFLMAMTLGGVDAEEPSGKRFLELVGCDKEVWSKNARKFVDPKNEKCLKSEYKELLECLDNSSLRTIHDSEKLEIKNKQQNVEDVTKDDFNLFPYLPLDDFSVFRIAVRTCTLGHAYPGKGTLIRTILPGRCFLLPM